jgi:hypothetical protein
MSIGGLDKSPLPTAQEVRELIGGLLGRDLEMSTGAPMTDPEGPGGAVVAEYVSDRLSLNALIAMDLGAAAHIGAALALMPPAVSKEAVAEGELTDVLLETAGEVLNVMAALFNPEGAPHLRLGEVHPPQSPLPKDVAPWIKAYVARLDLAINVPGYGPGQISVLVL